MTSPSGPASMCLRKGREGERPGEGGRGHGQLGRGDEAPEREVSCELRASGEFDIYRLDEKSGAGAPVRGASADPPAVLAAPQILRELTPVGLREIEDIKRHSLTGSRESEVRCVVYELRASCEFVVHHAGVKGSAVGRSNGQALTRPPCSPRPRRSGADPPRCR
jgi:hypothetical protein